MMASPKPTRSDWLVLVINGSTALWGFKDIQSVGHYNDFAAIHQRRPACSSRRAAVERRDMGFAAERDRSAVPGCCRLTA